MNTMRLQNNIFSAETGFTLIEVLVAMLIIAIGILGISALQYKGLQYNQDAYFRTQVNFLAYDLADRLRLNPDNAADYVSTYQVPATGGANTCTLTGLVSAADDLGCWRNLVDAALPPGSTADITLNGQIYTVTLSWTDRESTTHQVQYSFQI